MSDDPREPAVAQPAPATARERGIRQVLVCLDRSRLAETCLPHARFIADAFGATMTLLHVLASPEGDQPPSRPDALDWELTRREAEQYLAGIRSELEQAGFSRDRVTIDVTQGRPAERIIAAAHAGQADLTILSSHGEGGVGAWNLGSTTQQVLALAPGSILVTPADFATSPEAPVKRILVAVDGSLRTQSVLPEVAQLARFHGAELLLLHVVPELQPTAILVDEHDLELARSLTSRLRVSAERYLSRLRQQIFAEIASVEALVISSPDERRALLEVAGQRHADLLVLAAHGATCDAERPFGSMTAYALQHGRLPLLVLQDLPSRERDSSRPQAELSERPPGVRASFHPRELGDT